MKILLLEDNESLAEIIQEMLEDKGYSVTWFKDGEDALIELVSGYDCFVLDIHVPSLNGLELLKEIRDVNQIVPVIIISSDIELSTLQTAYLKGCNDFIKKPFYIQELDYKIDILCEKDKIVKLSHNVFFNFANEMLFEDKIEVKLTHKERRFIELLAKTPNVAIVLEVIIDYVYEGEDCTIDGLRSLVKRLRKKLPQDCIQTQNYGYLLKTKTI